MPSLSTGTGTRERILHYLQENRTATVAALSRTWGLTRADIRYHLNGLMEDGLVEVLPRDPQLPAPRGRPTQHYRLANLEKESSYAKLCGALLDLVFNGRPEEDRAATLEQLAKYVAGSDRPSGSNVQRLNQAIEFLNRQNYRARWEASPVGPRVILRRCPFAAILPNHPELCALDSVLINHLTGQPLKHTMRMDPDRGKPPHCIFEQQIVKSRGN